MERKPSEDVLGPNDPPSTQEFALKNREVKNMCHALEGMSVAAMKTGFSSQWGARVDAKFADLHAFVCDDRGIPVLILFGKSGTGCRATFSACSGDQEGLENQFNWKQMVECAAFCSDTARRILLAGGVRQGFEEMIAGLRLALNITTKIDDPQIRNDLEALQCQIRIVLEKKD